MGKKTDHDSSQEPASYALTFCACEQIDRMEFHLHAQIVATRPPTSKTDNPPMLLRDVSGDRGFLRKDLPPLFRAFWHSIKGAFGEKFAITLLRCSHMNARQGFAVIHGSEPDRNHDSRAKLGLRRNARRREIL